MKAQMNARRDRRGFTLIELVVVLLVLAGLAGILVPVVQNMVIKTHGSAGASNIAEVAKAIQLFEAQFFTNPSGFDSLIAAGDSAVGEDHFTVITLDAAGAEALSDAGIANVYDFTGPANTLDTFSSDKYASAFGLPRAIGNGGQVVLLNDEGIEELSLPPGQYAAFGVGERCELVGTTMLEAPVHFPEDGTKPTAKYSRFVAIYSLGGTFVPAVADDPVTPADESAPATVTGIGRAKLVTVAGLHAHGTDFELASLGKHLEEYYEN